jgi:dTDP-4-amino-4,6-dideoxygalactose transaminase
MSARSFAIPWASPLAQYRAHRKPIQAAISRVLEGDTYILGGEVESFERAFAEYCGVDHAIGVASGTDALILALRAIGLGSGDEVITVSHTAVATVAAILACGATPVLVDIDPGSYTIDPARIESAITARTKAIIPVHLYGQPAAMDEIAAIGHGRNLVVVEDCAQAAGARHRGRVVGGIGDIGCFSFYPTKNLGAIGDGGIVVTSNDEWAARVRRLRQYGWDEARMPHEIGVNSRLDSLQAAILSAKLPHLDADNARRAAVARRYDEAFAGLPLTSPAVSDNGSHVYHLYVIKDANRDRLRAHLSNDGIGSAIHYPAAVHSQKVYAEKAVVPAEGLPVTDRLVSQILSLPMYPELTDDEVHQVAASVRRYYGR